MPFRTHQLTEFEYFERICLTSGGYDEDIFDELDVSDDCREIIEETLLQVYPA